VIYVAIALLATLVMHLVEGRLRVPGMATREASGS